MRRRHARPAPGGRRGDARPRRPTSRVRRCCCSDRWRARASGRLLGRRSPSRAEARAPGRVSAPRPRIRRSSGSRTHRAARQPSVVERCRVAPPARQPRPPARRRRRRRRWPSRPRAPRGTSRGLARGRVARGGSRRSETGGRRRRRAPAPARSGLAKARRGPARARRAHQSRDLPVAQALPRDRRHRASRRRPRADAARGGRARV